MLEDLSLPKPEALYQPQGCKFCNDTGYSGRVMVYEFLAVTDKIRAAIHDGATGHELQELVVREGMIPRSRHALELAGEGMISHEDLMKVLI